jgi:hypothetical protein
MIYLFKFIIEPRPFDCEGWALISNPNTLKCSKMKTIDLESFRETISFAVIRVPFCRHIIIPVATAHKISNVFYHSEKLGFSSRLYYCMHVDGIEYTNKSRGFTKPVFEYIREKYGISFEKATFLKNVLDTRESLNDFINTLNNIPIFFYKEEAKSCIKELDTFIALIKGQ